MAGDLGRVQQILLHWKRDHLASVHHQHSDSVLPHLPSLQAEPAIEHMRANDVQGENVNLAADDAL